MSTGSQIDALVKGSTHRLMQVDAIPLFYERTKVHAWIPVSVYQNSTDEDGQLESRSKKINNKQRRNGEETDNIGEWNKSNHNRRCLDRFFKYYILSSPNDCHSKDWHILLEISRNFEKINNTLFGLYKTRTFVLKIRYHSSTSSSLHANLSKRSRRLRICSFWVSWTSIVGSDWNKFRPVFWIHSL